MCVAMKLERGHWEEEKEVWGCGEEWIGSDKDAEERAIWGRKGTCQRVQGRGEGVGEGVDNKNTYVRRCPNPLPCMLI